MSLYIMYGLIIMITLFLFIIIKDKRKAIKTIGILTISSSFLLIILALISKIIINMSITSINLSSVTNFLFIKFINNSLVLFVLGIIEIIISEGINLMRRNKNKIIEQNP